MRHTQTEIRGEVLRLDVPVVLQASVSSCVLAAVSGLIWYRTGRAIRQRDLSAELKQRWTQDGTTLQQARDLLRRHANIEIDERVTATFAGVTRAIEAQCPMLASLHVSERSGHMVTVVGVVRGATASVVINDPNLRWPLLVPWREFSASLSRIGFVTAAPSLAPTAPRLAAIESRSAT